MKKVLLLVFFGLLLAIPPNALGQTATSATSMTGTISSFGSSFTGYQTDNIISVPVNGGEIIFDKANAGVTIYDKDGVVVDSDSYSVRASQLNQDAWEHLSTNNATPTTDVWIDPFGNIVVTYTKEDIAGKFVVEYVITEWTGKIKTTAYFTNYTLFNHKIAFTETLQLVKDVKINGQVVDLNQYVGVTFDRETLEANQDIVIEARESVYNSGLGFENLWSVSIFDDRMIALDYANVGETQTGIGETTSLDPTIILAPINVTATQDPTTGEVTVSFDASPTTAVADQQWDQTISGTIHTTTTGNPATLTTISGAGAINSKQAISATDVGSIKITAPTSSFQPSTLRVGNGSTYYGIDYPWGTAVHSTMNGSQINHGNYCSATTCVYEVEINNGTVNLKVNGNTFRSTSISGTGFTAQWSNWSGFANASYTVELTGDFIKSEQAITPTAYDVFSKGAGTNYREHTFGLSPVAWQNPTSGLSVNGNTVTQTGSNSWNNEVQGTYTFPHTTGSEIEFTINGIYDAMVGFGKDPLGGTYSSIDYGLSPSGNGMIYIYENGNWASGFSNGTISYSSNDTFKVKMDSSGTVTYYQNGTLIHTSQNTASGTYYADATIYTTNASITANMLKPQTFQITSGSGDVAYEIQPNGSFNGISNGQQNYKIHKFTSSSNFQITAGSGDIEYLVVGGGGGGGNNHGGGGGAGGMLIGSQSLGTGTYTVTVGAGGNGGGRVSTDADAGGNGGDSIFNTITATGGGGGGARNDVNGLSAGQDGGSGGGGGGAQGSASLIVNREQGYANPLGQGNDGGAGDNLTGGGGGGAGSAGQDAPSTTVAGLGGSGITTDFGGTSTEYAHGGHGNNGNGGTQINTANTGNGGLGGNGAHGNGYAGASGVVIVRYVNDGSITATGGTVTTATLSPLQKSGTINLGTGTYNVSGDVVLTYDDDEITATGGTENSWNIPALLGTTTTNTHDYNFIGLGASADGTNNGATTGVTGKIGNAWDFDGSNDTVSMPSYDWSGNDWSISVWSNADQQSGTYNSGVMGNRLGASQSNWWSLGHSNWANGITLEAAQSYLTIQSGVSPLGWHHSVVTYDSNANTIELFVDGTSYGTASISTIGDINNTVELGHWHNNPNTPNYYDGKIDELVMYNKVLSSSEISALYNSGNGDSTPDTNGLLTYYNFEQTGNTLTNIEPTQTFQITSGSGDVAYEIQPYSSFNNITPTTGWDLAYTSYDNVSVSAHDAHPMGTTFSEDGTKMYVVGRSTPSVGQWNLSTAWDLSTASYTGNTVSVSSQEGSPTGVEFSNDGTKMFIVGAGNDTVYEYGLTTAWDITTASYSSNSMYIGSTETVPTSLYFVSDGTKLFIVGEGNKTIYQWNLSTGYDLSTASLDSNSFNVSSQDTAPKGLFFNSDGTELYIMGDANETVYQYTLTTGHDLSTASYTQSYSVSSQDTQGQDVTFNSLGTKMYLTGDANNKVYQYSITPSALTGTTNLSTGTYNVVGDVSLSYDDSLITATGGNESVSTTHTLSNILTKTPTYSDDFSSDNWTDTGFTGVSGGVLTGDLYRGTTNHGSILSLGSVVDNSQWVMRFQLDINTKATAENNSVALYLSDSGLVGINSNKDGLGLGLSQYWDAFRLLAPDNTYSFYNTANLTNITPEVGTYYIEIKRTSATTADMNIYSDSSYSTLLDSVVGHTISSGIQNLDTVVVQGMNDNVTSPSGTWNISIDDLKIWDGTDSATELETEYSEMPIAGITEEYTVIGVGEIDINILSPQNGATNHSQSDGVYGGTQWYYSAENVFDDSWVSTHTHPHGFVNWDTITGGTPTASNPIYLSVDLANTVTIPVGSEINFDSYNNGQGARTKHVNFQISNDNGATWTDLLSTDYTVPNFTTGDVYPVSGRPVKYFTATTDTEVTGDKFRVKLYGTYDSYNRYYIGGIFLNQPSTINSSPSDPATINTFNVPSQVTNVTAVDGMPIGITWSTGQAGAPVSNPVTVTYPDSLGASVDGTNNGATTGVTGKIGNGWDFDGSNDYVDLGTNIISDLNSFSFFAWVKPDLSVNMDVMGSELGASDGIRFKLRPTTMDVALDSGGSFPSVGSTAHGYSANTWHHVGFTWDGTSLKMYSDGSQLGSTGTGTYSPFTSTDLLLGQRPNYSVTFNGVMDEVVFYNKALTTSEVSALYNSSNGTLAPPASGLLAHYDFEQTGNTLTNIESVTHNVTVNSPPVISYDVIRDGTVLATVSAPTTQYTDNTVVAGQTYDYQIVATAVVGSGIESLTSTAQTISQANAPTNFTVNPNSSAQLVLDWTPSSDLGNGTLLAMQIDRSTDGGSTWTSLVQTTNTSPTYTDTTVVAGNTYHYRIASVNEAGIGTYSSTVGSIAGVPANPPSSVVATISDPNNNPDNVDITFSEPSSWGTGTPVSYEIYESLTGTGGWTQVANPTYVAGSFNTTITISNVLPNTDYHYMVRAISTHGSSNDSNTSMVTTPDVPTGDASATLAINNPNPSPLTITTTLVAPSSDGGSTVTGYNLWISNDDITYTQIATAINGTYDTTVSQSGTYYFKVEAINLMGTGNLGSAISITTPTVPTAPQNASSMIADADTSPYDVTVTWETPSSTGGSDLTQYNVYRKQGSGAYSLLTTTTGLSIIDTVPSLLTTNFTYKIHSVNNVGESTAFTDTTITTFDVPQAPTLSVTTGTTVLSWNTPTSDATVTNYKIYRDGSLVTTVGAVNTHTDFTPIVFGNSYDYKIVAVSSLGDSVDSNTVTTTPETEITGMVALGVTGTGAVIDWEEPAYYQGQVTSYNVYYGNTGTPSTSAGTTTNTYNNFAPQLEYDTTYVFAVSINSPLGNSGLSNIVTITTNVDGSIVAYDPNTGGMEWFDIDSVSEQTVNVIEFQRETQNLNVNGTFTDVDTLQVGYPSWWDDMTCDVDYKFAQKTEQYVEGDDMTAVVNSADANQQVIGFEFHDIDNEVIEVTCAPQVSQQDDEVSAKYIMTQQNLSTGAPNIPLVTQIQAFQTGDYGTDGEFGALDVVGLFVILISMVGFNRLNPIVGVLLSASLVFGLSFFGIISLPTVLVGVVALVIFLAWGITRNR